MSVALFRSRLIFIAGFPEAKWRGFIDLMSSLTSLSENDKMHCSSDRYHIWGGYTHMTDQWGGTHRWEMRGAHTAEQLGVTRYYTHSWTMRGYIHSWTMKGCTHCWAMRGYIHNWAMRGCIHSWAMRGLTHIRTMKGYIHSWAMRGWTHSWANRSYKHSWAIRGDT